MDMQTESEKLALLIRNAEHGEQRVLELQEQIVKMADDIMVMKKQIAALSKPIEPIDIPSV